MSDTESLTARQVRRLANLPEDHELVKAGQGSPIVRGPRGELLQVRPDGGLAPFVESVQSYLYVNG